MAKNMEIQVLFIHLVESLMVTLHALVRITFIMKVMTMRILEIAMINTIMVKRMEIVMARKMKKMKVVLVNRQNILNNSKRWQPQVHKETY